jgi:hypothetical protein
MPSYIHPTISIVESTRKGKGSSDTAGLKTLFESPISDINSADYKKIALDLLLRGEIVENLQAGATDRDFGVNATSESRRPPSYDKVPTGAAGLPASPWVPNPSSPGEGSSNPLDLPAAPEGYGLIPSNGLANIGGGSSDVTQQGRDPLVSSTRNSKGLEEDSLIPGKSPATANAS